MKKKTSLKLIKNCSHKSGQTKSVLKTPEIYLALLQKKAPATGGLKAGAD